MDASPDMLAATLCGEGGVFFRQPDRNRDDQARRWSRMRHTFRSINHSTHDGYQRLDFAAVSKIFVASSNRASCSACEEVDENATLGPAKGGRVGLRAAIFWSLNHTLAGGGKGIGKEGLRAWV